eukprot:9002920-Lingulodinium_polyedra.AAC.1
MRGRTRRPSSTFAGLAPSTACGTPGQLVTSSRAPARLSRCEGEGAGKRWRVYKGTQRHGLSSEPEGS